ncbi:MAG: 4-hydroxy-3-methylbut-2-enyl diphosphate reductase [Candidatus Latescibacterota bacterium]|nr:MAG: 4-hydroxy-3-methylbut-2-enyl diphosphate reductase [Candidatus Latescibacterota bacterium]
MKVELVRTAGFCFGVRRAVRMVDEALKRADGPVYTLGPLIHNPQMVARMEEMGVRVIGPEDDLPPGVVVLRSHGVPPQVEEKVKAKGHKVLDATCPFVRNAQMYARSLREEGYEVVIVGKRGHEEVEGILGYTGGEAYVVWRPEELVCLGRPDRVGVVAQTTTPFEIFSSVVSELLKRAKHIKVYNTICDSTSKRQEETAALAERADVMIIVGGRNSANTTRLAELCRGLGKATYHIETADELRPEWVEGASLVGVSAGASTPDWLIEEVMEKLKIWNEGGK